MDYILNKADQSLRQYTSLNGQVSNLKRKLKELNNLKEDKESRKHVELRPGKKLKKQVENWFENVERVNGEVQNLQEEVRSRSFVSRGLLGEEVLKKKEEVVELIQNGTFSDGLVVDEPTRIGQILPPTNIMGETIKQNMENIWELLMDESVGLIGVFGMGGVGKTTIMKEINNQLLNRKDLFDIVIWVTVSKELNIFRLQNDIANQLGVYLSKDEDETIRAGKLFEILAQKSKFAIILDDLWAKLSLDEVGIPQPSNRSKLVITTRSLEVCRYLNCEAIKVQPLVKEEAWNLFLEKAGRHILNYSNLESIAKSVADECAGLPLAIVMVASSMRGIYGPSEWRNALIELRRRIKSVNDIDGRVFQRLRFSYDRLNDEKIQSCFLWCAVFPEDFLIFKDDLIRYWIGDGLLDEMDSMKEKFDRGSAIINKLINNCLLEEHDCDNVKIYGAVRDMALRITKSRFLVKSGMQIRELPNSKEWPEKLEMLSLMRNRISEITLSVPSSKCQMITSLLLSENGISWIPEYLFEHMPSLKILDLSFNPFVSLPNSICNLNNLKTLLFRRCHSLENIPPLSNLKALEDLDLSETKINLKFLEIQENPNERFQNLSHLHHSNVKANMSPSIGKEIAGLKRLEFFAGQFDDLCDFNSYVVECLHNQGHFPTMYSLLVSKGSCRRLNFVYEEKRCIFLIGFDVECNILIMPTNVEELYIWDCTIGKSLSDCISCHATDQTRSQDLNGLLGTTAILESLQAVEVFSSLKSINIWGCAEMKKLFSPKWLLHGLQNLEEICVRSCLQMEEIIESDGEEDVIQFTLPKLRKFRLHDLPELKSICCGGGVLVCHLVEEIKIQTCPKLKRMPVSLTQLDDGQPFSPPPHLREITVWPAEWWKWVEWDLPNAKHLLLPFVTFRTTGLVILLSFVLVLSVSLEVRGLKSLSSQKRRLCLGSPFPAWRTKRDTFAYPFA